MNRPTPPPGWYPDPEGGRGQRYWNGSGWGQIAAPVSPPSAAALKNRRGFWIGSAVFAAVLALLMLAVDWSNGVQAEREATRASTTTAAPPTQTPAKAATPPTKTSSSTALLPVPAYTMIGQRERFDGQPIYYVLIAPVDLNTAAFKDTVKGVLQALAAGKRDPNFSAWIYDDFEVAELTYADQVTPPADTPEEIKAKAREREPHLIAYYSGGNPNSGDLLYGITWFPAATTSRSKPTIGQWVGNEEFKP